jgi:hypothetical protein
MNPLKLLAKNRKTIAEAGAFFLIVLVVALIADAALFQPTAGLTIGFRVNYADGTHFDKTPTSIPSLTINDPSNGNKPVVSFNVNLDSIIVYTLANGVSVSSWSFTGSSNLQVIDTFSGDSVSLGTFQLYAPNTISGQTLAPSGVSQILFSSTTSMQSNDPSSLETLVKQYKPSFSWVPNRQYNYVFTLAPSATITMHLSDGTNLSKSTTTTSTLTWAFVYTNSNTLSSLNMIWAGSPRFS